MPRRGENIYKRRDGRWEGRYISGRKPNGRAAYTSLYGKSYAEVRERLRVARTQQDQGITSRCKLTVKELLDRLLERSAENVKVSTCARYTFIAQKHIIPSIGTMKAKDLTAKRLSNFLEEKQRRGRLDGSGGLSAKTVRDIGVLLKSALKLASQETGQISEAATVKLPQGKPPKVKVFSECEMKLLAGAALAMPDISTAGVLLTLNTGLRLGELCALKWSDIDLQNGELRVSRTVQRVSDGKGGTKLVVQTPKSECSERAVPIPADMLGLLEKLSKGVLDEAYILTGRPFVPMEPRTYQYRFKALLRRCGLQDRNFHALRHSYATRCIEKGIDIKSVSEMLGHADIKTTLRLYVHSSMEHKKQAVQSICFLNAVS